MESASGISDLSNDKNIRLQDMQHGFNVVQHLHTQRKDFEQNIQLYNGDDPLELRYNFISWIEENYPNRGLDYGLIPVIEETLSLFKDDQKYAQDTRYVALLIKYIEMQPNPLDIYKNAYNQGRGTACAVLYHAWAKQCVKQKDFKTANEVYQLGISNKAEPLEDLKQVCLQFQLNVGRRLLGVNEDPPNTPCREALRKLEINNQSYHLPKDEKFESTEKRMQHKSVDKENASSLPRKLGQPQERFATSGVGVLLKGRIRADKVDTFSCPVFIHEPDDPTKKRMYPKDKIYPIKDQEFQLEEIMAQMHEKRKLMRKQVRCINEGPFDIQEFPVAYFEPYDSSKVPMYPKDKVYAVEGKEFQLEELKAFEYEQKQKKLAQESNKFGSGSSVKTPNTSTQEMQVQVLSEKSSHDSNSNISMLNNQSYTVNTKEVFNIVRGMWKSPSPVAISKIDSKTPTEVANSEPFKVPQPPKSGFTLYVDESAFAEQLPSTSMQHQNHPVTAIDAENIPPIRKNGSTTKNVCGLQEKRTCTVQQVYQHKESVNIDSDLGVNVLTGCVEINDENCRSEKKLAARQPFTTYTDEVDSVKSSISVGKKTAGLMSTITPNKTSDAEPCCSSEIAVATTSERKSRFIIQCDDEVSNKEACNEVENDMNNYMLQLKCVKQNQLPSYHPNMDVAGNDQPVTLPYVPPPVNEIPVQEDEGKENFQAHNFLRKAEKRELSGVLQPALNIPFEHLQNLDKDNDFANDTCNTKAFAFDLPSSTPFPNQFRNVDPTDGNENTAAYCSYLGEDMPKATTELSVILEASKERYSSSSGSSSSGQTPYGPSHYKPLNTYSEIKGSELHNITEESINDLEKSMSQLNLGNNIDPFCPELLSKLLARVKFPQKHHKAGYITVNHDAPVLRENCSLTLGKEKYDTGKELGKGSYARVLKATHKGQYVALKFQKPPFLWEYYIACEIQKRLANSPVLYGFIEINRAYIFNNASILEAECGRYGSLINVVNAVKLATGKSLKLTVATLLCIQIFSIVEHLHKCKIIHGDIKPDNFILYELPTNDLSKFSVKLIDFGRSIDMTLLPEGTTFTTVVTTDDFQCNEMKENLPWTYQTDYYGLAGTAYCLLMGDYMKVIKRRGDWTLQPILPRYMHRDVWQPIFHDLLNIESCTSLPDLSQMKTNLEKSLDSVGRRLLLDQLNSFYNILQGH
ncbi:mitotic checkpoint serine/threonine-protein kinase BUB1-like [Lycorma delicatula]|uniref:mitotic checkpoint serine/threonine-protein kinase BUB1-like n=1 Tax=Lycorma delicatula TaxID=130591 RepID=UPI003F50F5BF